MISAMRTHGAPGDDDALDQLMRRHLHQRPVLAGARFALVGVAEDVFRLRRFFGHEAPLHARGKSRAAAPAKIRLLHFLDHLLGRKFLERALQALVAVVLQVDIQVVRIRHAEQAADNRNFSRMPLVNRARDRRRGLRLQSSCRAGRAIDWRGRASGSRRNRNSPASPERRCRRRCTRLLRAKTCRRRVTSLWPISSFFCMNS